MFIATMRCSKTFCEEQYLKFQIRALSISGEKLKLVEIVLPSDTMHDVKPFLYIRRCQILHIVYNNILKKRKRSRSLHLWHSAHVPSGMKNNAI